ncbi:peptidoglycan DD-metalloendopeptidase family protein [Caballeronia grimmiae]|uniref:peptidoglycan DD-metalloendopeptidase family protein n=1 Tax=Caballeronia grimmiae TaxID=1071679 RepID=UPI0038B8327F
MQTGLFGPRHRAVVAGLALAAGMAAVTSLTGCTSTPRSPAPIVENTTLRTPPAVASAPNSAATAASSTPVAPGFYRVKPGDTLYGISRLFKQKPADLAAWNSLTESKQVNVGQVLRVAPPGAAGSAPATATAAASASAAGGKDLPPLIAAPAKPAAEAPPAKTAEEHASAAKATFAWPAKGEIVRKFGASGSKGIDIAGKVGQPVKAAASGKVVYAGSGLRSYGRMIIVRHSNDYLTAYAYNDKLLVREGDSVKQGATIADMGTGPGGSAVLHFEVRKSGAAVDPVPLLGAGG